MWTGNEKKNNNRETAVCLYTCTSTLINYLYRLFCGCLIFQFRTIVFRTVIFIHCRVRLLFIFCFAFRTNTIYTLYVPHSTIPQIIYFLVAVALQYASFLIAHRTRRKGEELYFWNSWRKNSWLRDARRIMKRWKNERQWRCVESFAATGERKERNKWFCEHKAARLVLANLCRFPL